METEIRAAARWWRDTLAGPFKQDNGDPSPQGAMAAGLAALTRFRSRPQIPPEAYERFEQALIAALRAASARPVAPSRLWVGVDYGPDRTLATAAEAAGLPTGISYWPWKTQMWLEPGSVKVRYGYGAAPMTIYSEDAPHDPR